MYIYVDCYVDNFVVASMSLWVQFGLFSLWQPSHTKKYGSSLPDKFSKQF